MKDYIVHDGWKFIEDGFHPEHNKITESLMSLGTGEWGTGPISRRNIPDIPYREAMWQEFTTLIKHGRMVEEWLSRIFCQSTECGKLDRN